MKRPTALTVTMAQGIPIRIVIRMRVRFMPVT
jgi:hypothetical protein